MGYALFCLNFMDGDLKNDFVNLTLRYNQL